MGEAFYEVGPVVIVEKDGWLSFQRAITRWSNSGYKYGFILTFHGSTTLIQEVNNLIHKRNVNDLKRDQLGGEGDGGRGGRGGRT